MFEPKRRGLSGEHIQLCAEGARFKPNLSGKWTEMQYAMLEQSFIGLLFMYYKKEEVISYVQ